MRGRRYRLSSPGRNAPQLRARSLAGQDAATAIDGVFIPAIDGTPDGIGAGQDALCAANALRGTAALAVKGTVGVAHTREGAASAARQVARRAAFALRNAILTTRSIATCVIVTYEITAATRARKITRCVIVTEEITATTWARKITCCVVVTYAAIDTHTGLIPSKSVTGWSIGIAVLSAVRQDGERAWQDTDAARWIHNSEVI